MSRRNNKIDKLVGMKTGETSPTPMPTPEDAQAILLKARQVRVDACTRELKEMLARHRCKLDVVCMLTTNNISFVVNVNPAD
jgi:hypothetical protein